MCTVVCLMIVFFFCFKQKTAYEMRISDWSSDVCSSDLCAFIGSSFATSATCCGRMGATTVRHGDDYCRGSITIPARCDCSRVASSAIFGPASIRGSTTTARWRSEEHTSELQSLMRISYAVFCLKKKKLTTNNLNYDQVIHH